jgi:hypothetical protein
MTRRIGPSFWIDGREVYLPAQKENFPGLGSQNLFNAFLRWFPFDDGTFGYSIRVWSFANTSSMMKSGTFSMNRAPRACKSRTRG